jgi:hypothetical protein
MIDAPEDRNIFQRLTGRQVAASGLHESGGHPTLTLTLTGTNGSEDGRNPAHTTPPG